MYVYIYIYIYGSIAIRTLAKWSMYQSSNWDCDHQIPPTTGDPSELLSASSHSDGPVGYYPPPCVYAYMRGFVIQHLYIHTHMHIHRNKLPGGPSELLSASSHSDGPLGIITPPVCVHIYAWVRDPALVYTTHIHMYRNKLPGGPPELLSASSHSDGPLGITPPPVCVCIYA